MTAQVNGHDIPRTVARWLNDRNWLTQRRAEGAGVLVRTAAAGCSTRRTFDRLTSGPDPLRCNAMSWVQLTEYRDAYPGEVPEADAIDQATGPVLDADEE